MARSLWNQKFFQGSLVFSVLVVFGFLQRFSHFGENHSFGVVFFYFDCFGSFWIKHGWFMIDNISVESKVLPLCIGF